MTPEQTKAREEMRAKTHMLNPAMWVLDNEFVNENQQPFEFDNHRFMLQPYADSSPDQVIMKSAQVGWSVLAIIKSVHAANFIKLNVIYVLPTRNASAEFVVPKVNPMLQRNPALAKLVKSTDNKSLKQIGDRWIYFKGAFHQGEAISTSADLIVADEYDRSDQAVLSTYQSRLQASPYRWYWKFSNPSLPGFGVHELWQESDQMHWMVKCPECKHEHYMGFERDDVMKNHYVDVDRVIFACGKCHTEITNKARKNGRWWALYPNRERRGYWLSQMIVPWVDAKLILKQQREMSIDDFYNFVLGLPYQASEFMLNAEAIKNATFPGNADKTDVIIGVDSGKTKHYVIGNRDGVFNYGTTEDWEYIERMIVSLKATCVIDALPDFTIPQYLSEKYPGQVFVHYYSHNSKDMQTSKRNEGVQYGRIDSDRTKLFDQMAGDISTQKLKFFMDYKDLVGKNGMGLVYHMGNMYRMIETDPKGIQRAVWMTKENKPDHWAHALAYYRAGRSLLLSSSEVGGVMPRNISAVKGTVTVSPDNTVPVKDAIRGGLDSLVERSLAKHKKKRIG